MKNFNNMQDRKFEKQVNHLSGFIGSPMWNGRNPTLSEIREHDRLLLEKQVLGFEAKRKSILKRLIGSAISSASEAFGKVAKARVKTHEKKEFVKISPECCG